MLEHGFGVEAVEFHPTVDDFEQHVDRIELALRHGGQNLTQRPVEQPILHDQDVVDGTDAVVAPFLQRGLNVAVHRRQSAPHGRGDQAERQPAQQQFRYLGSPVFALRDRRLACARANPQQGCAALLAWFPRPRLRLRLFLRGWFGSHAVPVYGVPVYFYH